MGPKNKKPHNEEDEVVTMGALRQLIEQQFALQTDQLSKDLHLKISQLENDLLAVKEIAEKALQVATLNETRIATLEGEN